MYLWGPLFSLLESPGLPAFPASLNHQTSEKGTVAQKRRTRASGFTLSPGFTLQLSHYCVTFTCHFISRCPFPHGQTTPVFPTGPGIRGGAVRGNRHHHVTLFLKPWSPATFADCFGPTGQRGGRSPWSFPEGIRLSRRHLALVTNRQGCWAVWGQNLFWMRPAFCLVTC